MHQMHQTTTTTHLLVLWQDIGGGANKCGDRDVGRDQALMIPLYSME